jgi:hypothetical protein
VTKRSGEEYRKTECWSWAWDTLYWIKNMKVSK